MQSQKRPHGFLLQVCLEVSLKYSDEWGNGKERAHRAALPERLQVQLFHSHLLAT